MNPRKFFQKIRNFQKLMKSQRRMIANVKLREIFNSLNKSSSASFLQIHSSLTRLTIHLPFVSLTTSVKCSVMRFWNETKKKLFLIQLRLRTKRGYVTILISQKIVFTVVLYSFTINQKVQSPFFRDKVHGICFLISERDIIDRFYVPNDHHQCCSIL